MSEFESEERLEAEVDAEIEEFFCAPELEQESDPTVSIEIETTELSSNVCDTCFEENLVSSVGILKCERCENAFCLHFASKLDVHFCVNCMSEFSVEKTHISKTYEHQSPDGTVTKSSRRARQIKPGGLDWLFAQRKIYSLTDVELELSLEFHKGILNLILAESEKRKIERIHKYAGIKAASIPTTVTTTSTTVTTQTKKIKTGTTKKNEQVASLFDALLTKGLKTEDILRMLKNGGGK